MSKEKTKRRIRQATAAAAALLLAAAFTFPSGTEIMGISFGNAIVASAATSADDFSYRDNGDGTVTITKYTGSGGTVEIPDTIDGKSVISINLNAFYNCKSLTSITIPNSVTSIGVYAFSDCTSLESVTLPSNSSFTSINSSAFYNCTSLKSITIPNSVTSINNDAFQNCTSLESVTLPSNSSFTSINNGTFYNCTSLKSVTIPNSVTSIGINAFSGCTSLESVTIPNSVTSIGINAFSRCTSLESVTLPSNSSFTSIEGGAFYNCTSLKSITIPDSVTTIEYKAFYNCTSLESITIPAGVTFIGYGAYSDSTKVTINENNSTYTTIDNVLFSKDKTTLVSYPNGKGTSYVIPDSVTSIDNCAFYNCTSLTSITLPSNSSFTSIGDDTFSDCTSLKGITIPDSVTSIGNRAFYNCTSLESVTLPSNSSFTSIGDDTFNGCTSLKGITIPDSVTSIGEWAFCECTSLETITIPDSVTSIGVCAFERCTSLTSVTLPSNSSFTSIGYGTFSGCTSLKGITIPDSVTSIGEGAFERCTSLETITIPDSVTSIGVCAFSNCTSLTSVTLPSNSSFTSIGDGTFNGCTSLKGITIPGSVTCIGFYAFGGCTSLESITLTPNSSFPSIEEDTFYDCTSLEVIFLPNDIYITSEYIPDTLTQVKYTVADNKVTITEIALGPDRTSVDIPEAIGGKTVTSIGNGAFGDCTNLTSVSFADNSQLISIGDLAFQNCTSLADITVPSSVTSIGAAAFGNCTSLTSIDVDEDNAAFCSIGGVLFNKEKTSLLKYPINKSGVSYTIPDSVISIEHLAFADCANLESIVIPNGVASIGIDAFCNTKLTSIVIPKSVKSIGNYAFQRNGKLESVTFEENSELTSIPEYAFDGCSSLKSINIPSSVASIEERAFRRTGLTSITIPANVTFIGESAFYDCRSLTSIFLPDGLDVTNADIPETATKVRYTVADNKVTITEIALGTDRTSVDLPETIGGYPVAAVADDCLSMIGSHTHYYDSNNTCTICGFVRPNKNENGYYEITNADQLFWFAEQANGGNYGINAILVDNITVNTGVLKSDGTIADDTSGFRSWTPIGSFSDNYKGTFDGANHTISGLYFNNPDGEYVGLFGVSCGTIKNVGVVDSYFNGKQHVGGVCGGNKGTISNCYNAGAVSVTENYVGGVCGSDVFGTITNCYNTGAVSGVGFVGGVCGYQVAKGITNCYNTGVVTGTEESVGGVCGSNDGGGRITNCYYLDTIKNDSNATAKTADEFGSGEVAYLLQGDQATAVWGQTIGTENYPVFGGAKVYRNETYKGCAGEPGDPTYSYSNKEEKPVYAEHKLSPVNEKAATCTEDGNIEHYKCDVCGKLFADDKAETELTLKEVTITAAHKLSPVEAKDATCTEDGNIKHYKCDVCGKLFADDKAETEVTLKEVTITAAHKLSLVEAKDATCTEDGNIKHYKCDVCGKLFADESGETETTLEAVTISAIGHTITHIDANDPTCTEDGNIEHYKCSVCNKLFADKNGQTELTLKEVTITAAHKLSLVEAKAATCTEDGNIEHYKCDVCGKLFADKNAEKEITLEEVTFPKSGHSKDEGIVNKASLTANSITISYNCPVCGEYIGEETVSVTITNVEVTAGKVVVSYTITETGKARTLEYTLDEVTAALADIMKSSNIQLVIDFVNSFTAADTDGILTDAQLKAIDYVLAYDFG